MSRLEAGAWEPNKEEVPFSEVLATVLTSITDAEAARIELDVPDDLPLISIDETQMEQVLLNLIENALKYSPPDTQLHLQARLRAEKLEVSLCDHGPGIPVGEEKAIFQKFHRGRLMSEGGPAGSGLGLAICKRLVESWGGSIAVESQPGKGTTVTIVTGA